MLSGKIDYSFTSGRMLENFKETKEVHPSSYGMFWCMAATCFYRIFTRDDMKEFLFRLSISLHSMNLLENWLMNDRLFDYKLKDRHYRMTVKDIMNHFGFEAYDACENSEKREFFLANVGGHIFNASFSGILEKLEVIPFESAGEDIKLIPGKKHAPKITEEIIKNAGFFASDLMKLIPDEMFTQRSEALIEKEKQLKLRREKIRNLPVFKINKIPADIIRQCLMTFYAEDYTEYLLKEPEDFETFGRPMIYLAWLYANNMIESDGITAHPIEGVRFNYDDYELEDGGINLLITISEYNMDDTIQLLKGVGLE